MLEGHGYHRRQLKAKVELTHIWPISGGIGIDEGPMGSGAADIKDSGVDLNYLFLWGKVEIGESKSYG